MLKTYDYEITDMTSGEIRMVCKALGAEGWRLVAVDNFRFYWEKEIQTKEVINRAPKRQIVKPATKEEKIPGYGGVGEPG